MIKELALFAIFAFLALAAVIGGSIALQFAYDRWECEGYQKATRYPTKFVNGLCYIEFKPDQWLTREDINKRYLTRGTE